MTINLWLKRVCVLQLSYTNWNLILLGFVLFFGMGFETVTFTLDGDLKFTEEYLLHLLEGNYMKLPSL
jgi:hypothetical protein